jgi:hypothetical protein
MALAARKKLGALTLFALGAAAAGAQYSTPVGSGAAKPKTLCATAVLEWTGPLEKPTASRLMPVAVWDGEHYQPAGLYLARPAPLAFEAGTQYELERGGEPVGLFDVHAATQLFGAWIGMGKFQPEAAPPPPPKLEVSKHLPVELHGKVGAAKGASPSQDGDKTAGNAGIKPADTTSPGTDDKPTLHRRPSSADEGSAGAAGTASSSGNPPAKPSGGTPQAGSGSSSTNDSDAPTLHRRSDSADSSDTKTGSSKTDPGSDSTKASDTDAERPTLHKPAAPEPVDPKDDRPTLHHARTASFTSANIDPDRPHLRYGQGDVGQAAELPARLTGLPASMQQIVAVSDTATGEDRAYQYRWPNPGDGAKMQAALAAIAAQLIARPDVTAGAPVPQFGPASRGSARKARPTRSAPVLPLLVDERFAAYELTFSGGPTLVYTAHTAAEGPQRVYVTLIAQPDFNGTPQILLKQVARGDRLDETPAMQLVDAVDTDGDHRAELIFQLTGATTVQSLIRGADGSSAAAGPPAATPASMGIAHPSDPVADAAAAAAAVTVQVTDREFAIYRVANGRAEQVFTTGPLP